MSGAAQTARMVLRAPETRSAVPIRVPAPAVRAAQAAAAVRVSQPSDPAEREAERVARRVVGLPASATAPQARRFNAVVPAPSSALPSALGVGSSAGQPLPRRVRRDMEPRFGADFSSVRVHTGDAAAKASRRLNAAAFTAGRDVFFGRGRFQPEATPGRELIAHELAHTIQQGAAAQPATVQRSVDNAVRERSAPQVQRLGIQDALDYFAEKAEWIPGFSMLALLLGFNPVSLRAVPRTAANLLRALVQLIPGGPLITQALDNHGIVDRVAAWAEGQLSALGDIGSAIRQSIDEFLDSLGWSDIFDLGDVWARAKRIVTTPIDRIIAFGSGLVGGIIGFIKDAILRPIASLIEPTRGYPLLKAVLGFDPVTGDAAPRNATTLLGGFMTLIGQDEVWQNIQRGNAIAQAWAWFEGALAGLMGFVTQIPTVFLNAFRSLELVDIILVPRAFAKIVGVFASFAGQFVSWGLGTVIKLLEIIFSVVAPGAMGYLRRAGGAIEGIFRNPIGFVMNLVRAAKAGFQRFAGRFFTHLKKGLLDWLTGSLTDVYIPSALSLPEIVKFAFSVLGLTWAHLRAKLVTAFGEPAVQAMEKGFDIVKTLVTQGPAAAWEQLKDELIAQKDKVVDGIRDMVIEAVVTKAVPKVVAMFIPGAGFIGAIVSIYDTVMTFVAQLSRIKQVVTSFVDSMMAIAGGAIDAAAARVETTLAGLLSLAINFLAGFAGLGKIATKIKGIIEKIRTPIDKVLDSMVGWIKKTATGLGKFLVDKGKSAAELLFEWWKAKVPFSDKKGRAHKLFFSGQGESARVKVASDEMFTEDFIAKVRKVFAEDKVAESFGLRYLNESLQKQKEVDKLKAQLEREKKANLISVKSTDQKLRDAMGGLAASMRPLFDVLPENQAEGLPVKPGDKVTLPYKGTERMAEILFASTLRVNYEVASLSAKMPMPTTDFRQKWAAGLIRPYVEGGSREKYLGATPGKASATGKQVVARYKTRVEGVVVLVEWQPGKWHPLSDCDMSHKEPPGPAVAYWNRVRKITEPKSSMVRDWMLDPNNYFLEPLALNRSRGARGGERYLPP